MNKKSLIIIPAVILLLVIGGLFFALKQATAPEKAVETLKKAVANDDPALLQDMIVPDNKQASVNKTSVQALITYLKENSSSYDVIKEGLDEQIQEDDYTTTTQQVTLTEDGKKWGMFPQYKLKVKTAAIKVTGQNEDDRISLAAGKSNQAIKKQKDNNYGPVIPGTYNLKVKLMNELGTFEKKEKKDVWGSPEVSVVIDSNALASSDKGIQKDVIKAMDVFNNDIAVYQTSGFNKSKLTNVTDTILEGSFTLQESFKAVQGYIDEIHAQYNGAVVNMDDFSVHYFDGRWSADVTALIAYHNKVKYRDIQQFEDTSFKAVNTYSLSYDRAQKKWLIDDVKNREPVGKEEEYWKNKQEVKVSNPPLLKWKREGVTGTDIVL
ncbi:MULTISPECIES: hypothetical protein [Bacillaceae]|uniref:TcaA second domain-containing protein n=1 Tax=Bacillaceae TaxID=186817 RepID=UPI000E72EC2A|nr:hypothetical protein [Bacillus sp. PK3_68]RJS61223.1 hypothetical protein CJ483_15150 [Bacillus sp. PK3_68]